MTQSDTFELVGYLIGSFGIGWAFGFLIVLFQRALDSI